MNVLCLFGLVDKEAAFGKVRVGVESGMEGGGVETCQYVRGVGEKNGMERWEIGILMPG